MSSIKEVAHDQAHDHIDHVAHCPITHMPTPQGAPSLSSVLTMIPICPHFHCPYVKKDVKLSKSCQVVKKMSNVKKSNTQTMEEVHQKNKLT